MAILQLFIVDICFLLFTFFVLTGPKSLLRIFELHIDIAESNHIGMRGLPTAEAVVS
jgi:hypothetical protein